MSNKRSKTKNILKKNLIELLKYNSIKDITVSRLSNASNINRSTFYLHYKDIYQLLNEMEDEVIETFKQISESHSTKDLQKNPHKILYDYFTYIKENKEIFMTLFNGKEHAPFINKIKLLIKRRCLHEWDKLFKVKEDPKFDFYYSFISSGFIGLLEIWQDNNFKESPEELADIALDLMLNGIGLFLNESED
ncbi:MAG: TetR-like C-terminal domain-containing protein [Tissierellia bacterium]|nr:TetR-like C-terminal domain-containing protein [Tissierellia bacterium]